MSRDVDTKQSESEIHITSLRLTRAQHARLKELAEQQERTVSQEVRLLVTRHLAESEKAAA